MSSGTLSRYLREGRLGSNINSYQSCFCARNLKFLIFVTIAYPTHVVNLVYSGKYSMYSPIFCYSIHFAGKTNKNAKCQKKKIKKIDVYVKKLHKKPRFVIGIENWNFIHKIIYAWKLRFPIDTQFLYEKPGIPQTRQQVKYFAHKFWPWCEKPGISHSLPVVFVFIYMFRWCWFVYPDYDFFYC